jgi:RimJ/RimL family protein N-acetyltransferase
LKSQINFVSACIEFAPAADRDRLFPMPQPDFQPTLVGPTVTVRPIAADDWTALYAAGSDPQIWKVHPVRDRHTKAGLRTYFDGALESKMAFAFVERATGRLIGSSRYYGFEPEQSEIEIGWTFLVRSHWGGATNREVKRLMLDHAFSFVDTVIFWVGVENWRSQGAMKKIGGVLREGRFTRELSGDSPYVIFEITKGRYENGGRALVA